MCGIVAALDFTEPVEREMLERGVASLRHRGPNANSIWVDNKKYVGLGHARLSIMDLETGQQPICNETETIHAVVNGEFYDFERIRSQLISQGHVFKTKSDSEILIHLYETWGAGCLAHLRGEFAFVLWDENAQTLFAARDRFGIKPLYYAKSAGRMLFASEAKALFRMGVVSRWDTEAFGFGNYFVMPEDRTLFSGVSQVPPAHYLLFNPRSMRAERYWDCDFPTENLEAHAWSDEECEEALRAALSEAVRIRLRADVPVGCYLSGGLDSSAILGLAAAQAPKAPKAFTISFEGEIYDETPLAAETAKRVGSELECIRVGPSDLFTHFPKAIYHSESIALNTNGVAKFLLSEAVRDAGYRVVLTGEGADEIFAGYPHFVRDSILHEARAGKDPSSLLSMLQAQNPVFQGLISSLDTSPNLERVRQLLGYVPSLWSSFYSIGCAREQLFKEDYKAQTCRVNPYEQFLFALDRRGQLTGRSVVNQSQYLWSKTWLPEYILRYLGDRMEMAHSIEGRVPFLDHHLFETARSMTARQKIRGMSEKFALKRAVAPFVTQAVVQRRKHPFAAPPSLLSGDNDWIGFLHDLTAGMGAHRQPFFDTTKVRRFLEQVPRMDESQRKSADPVLVSVASTYLLGDLFSLTA